MGYILEGAVFATCIGAYRVYTDRRKALHHSNWDNYRLLMLNFTRHSTDFAAKVCFDVICHFPKESRDVLDKFSTVIPHKHEILNKFRDSILRRSARFYIWSNAGSLGYLQRVSKISPGASMFASDRSWKHNLVYTTPTFISYVKDPSIKDYLTLLAIIRDGMVGVIETSPTDLNSFVKNITENKRSLIQDIRKGHTLDRKPESSVQIVHALRMEIEGFLFGNTGPDADRSTFIEKAIKDQSDGLIERLFPFLEVVVDLEGTSLKSGRNEFEILCPNIEIFVPFLKVDGEIIGIGLGKNEFVLDPLHRSILIDGSQDWEDLKERTSYQLSVEGGQESIKIEYVGRQGQALRVRV